MSVIRRIIAAALCGLVPLGALYAPFLHAHLDDGDSDHHHGREIHAHLGGHNHHAPPVAAPWGGTALTDDDDDDAIAADVFVAVSAPAFAAPSIATASFALIAPAVTACGRTPHVSHGHDPPATPAAKPRAPPALFA